jgi:hemerythrin-like domain-containing protein
MSGPGDPRDPPDGPPQDPPDGPPHDPPEDPLALDIRGGLPDALRTLLADYPRAGWEAEPRFDGLVRFWLDRHLMFRRLLALLAADAEALAEGRIEPAAYAPRLARLGSTLVGELEGHHGIEDSHYFPLLARLEPRLSRGFEILDADHVALDRHLAGFVAAANAVLQAPEAARREAGARFLAPLGGLGRLIDRHLVDEEELVVPVILRHGPGGLDERLSARGRPRPPASPRA